MEGFTYRRSSHKPIRKRWTDFGRGPYSVHSVIESPCPQSELYKQLPISFGALQSMPCPGGVDLSPLKYPTVKLVARPQEKPCHEEIAVQ